MQDSMPKPKKNPHTRSGWAPSKRPSGKTTRPAACATTSRSAGSTRTRTTTSGRAPTRFGRDDLLVLGKVAGHGPHLDPSTGQEREPTRKAERRRLGSCLRGFDEGSRLLRIVPFKQPSTFLLSASTPTISTQRNQPRGALRSSTRARPGRRCLCWVQGRSPRSLRSIATRRSADGSSAGSRNVIENRRAALAGKGELRKVKPPDSAAAAGAATGRMLARMSGDGRGAARKPPLVPAASRRDERHRFRAEITRVQRLAHRALWIHGFSTPQTIV